MALRLGLGLYIGAAGVGLPAPSVTVDAPVSTGGNSILLAGVATTVSGTCTAGTTVTVAWNGVLLGSAAVVGTSWTYAWTPTAPQEGVFNLTATATNPAGGLFTVSAAKTPLVLADASLRVRANDTATYTRTGGALTSVINAATGATASTLIGTPGWTADDAGSGKPAFTFATNQGVGGTEAALVSVLSGGAKPFACFVVHRLAGLDTTGVYFGSALSSHAGNHQTHFGQSTAGAGIHYFYRISGAGNRIFLDTVLPTAAGRQILETRSADGLSVFGRLNGGTEVSEVLTDLTGVAPNRWAIGCAYGSAPSLFLTGSIFEILHINAHKSPTIMTAIRDRLAADWI